MQRVIVFSLVLLLTVATLIPLSYAMAHWNAAAHRHHHHSRAWWRHHRAMLRRHHSLATRSPQATTGDKNMSQPMMDSAHSFASGAPVPFNLVAPSSWRTVSSSPLEKRFAVRASDGHALGTAVFTSVGYSSPDSSPVKRRGMLGGMSLAELRRMVINEMIAENGWVVNDIEREVNGRRLFVVLAQSGPGGVANLSHSFYFTELDGRIYALKTTAPLESAEPLAAQSEQVLASLGMESAGREAMTAKASR